MKRDKSRGSYVGLTTVMLLLLAGAGYVYLWPSKPIQSVTLTSGDVLDMFFLAHSNEIEVDIRTPGEKLREMLPDKWQTAIDRKFPSRHHSTWISMSNVAAAPSLAIGLKYRDISGPKHNLSYETTWVISDENGWYDSGIHGGSILDDNIVCRVFTHVPFTAPRLKLSVYSCDGLDVEPKELLGSFEFSNPAYDRSLKFPGKSAIPNAVTTDAVALKIHRFVTGIHLPNVPVFLYNTFLHRLSRAVPQGIDGVIDGNPRVAIFPETTRSALVFTPEFKSGNPAQSLRNAKLEFTNSQGHSHPVNLSVAYVSSGTCCLVFDQSLPTGNGTYAFELTLYQDPPSDASNWVSMAELIPSSTDLSSTRVLYLGSNKIEAGMSQGNDIVNLTATEDPSLLAVRAEVTGTSEPLALTPLQDGSAGPPFSSFAVLGQPVTSGTVTLSFAKTLEHKVTFEGVPERAK